MKTKQSGFTLVEIAIVLVIVGLLLGGVLKGQELIFNTRIKSTYSMSREFTAALTGYQDRYKSLPGDDGAATTRFPAASPAASNGNSDGLISVTASWQCPTGVTADEHCQANYHLRLSGFLSGAGSEAPKTAFSTPAHIIRGDQLIGGFTSSPVMGMEPTGLSHKIMSALDTSFDDGNPATGTVRCQSSLTSYNLSTPDQSPGVWCLMLM